LTFFNSYHIIILSNRLAPRLINRKVSGGVIFYGNKLIEPGIKKVFAFFDGQNLFHSAKEAFGYTYPNFDPILLAKTICQRQGWRLDKILFYTGVPAEHDNKFWSTFWVKKLAIMGTRGVAVFSRELRYQNKIIKLKDGSQESILMGQEKGIDVRLALDVIRFAWDQEFDIALIFSQDQDLSEVADEVRRLANVQSRWIKVASAFPKSPTSINKRGINKTDWISIDKSTYDSCLDTRNYIV
jgi:uncharacterized LabA/DUF88 family protein